VAVGSDARAIRQRLLDAADGLVYSSEGDYPFEYVSLPEPPGGAPLTARSLATLVGAPASSTVSERPLADFLARHIDRIDPMDHAAQALRPRYEALLAAMVDCLPDARVFRVGRVEIRCYIVGRDGQGHIVGLATTAIET
jgi:hypothetical protein